MVFFVTAGVLCLAALQTHDAAEIVLSSLAMTAFLLGCLLCVWLYGGLQTLFDLRLGPWVFAYASVAFGAASITVLAPLFTSVQVTIALLSRALFLLACGFAVCVVGYRLPVLSAPLARGLRFAIAAATRGRSTRTRSVPILYAVFAAGVLGDALKIVLTGQLGYLGDATLVDSESAQWYTQPLEILSTLKIVALFGLSLSAFRARGSARVMRLLPALVVAVPLGVATGMKEAFVDIVLAVLLPYIFVRGRARIVPLLLAAAVFVLVVTPFVTQLRQEVRGPAALGVDDALETAWARSLDLDQYLADSDPVESALQVASRVRLVDNFILIGEKTPSAIPYRDPMDILAAPLQGVVPRAVWPDKPVRLAGYEFYKVYYQGQGQSSSAVTLQGSLYMHGGLGVFLVGMFVVGVLLRATDDGLRARSSPFGALFLLLLAPVVVKQEMDVPGFLASLPVLLITWLVGVWGIFGPRPSITRVPVSRKRAMHSVLVRSGSAS